jgi:hypothetical protein
MNFSSTNSYETERNIGVISPVQNKKYNSIIIFPFINTFGFRSIPFPANTTVSQWTEHRSARARTAVHDYLLPKLQSKWGNSEKTSK